MEQKRISLSDDTKALVDQVMPAAAIMIINRLEEAGFEAYAVGGCVRDCLLGRKPQDWDITTSAKPEQVKELFRRTFDTGIEHGTVTVLEDHIGYEVTTYRIDGDYEDGRHPKQVAFTNELREDLRRRDFTINAMAFHPKRGLVDLFDGLQDLEQGIIRCVGDARERFMEDALRILRAVRFSAQLGFAIEEKTYEAICELCGTLDKISKERIHTELNKLLLSDHPDHFRILYETGITGVIMPEFDKMMDTAQNHPYHYLNVGEHTIQVMKAVRADRALRWAALLHDVGKPACRTTDEAGIDHFWGHCESGEMMAKEIMRGLKMDNDTIHTVVRLVRWHDYRCPADRQAIRHAVNTIGEDIFPMALELMYADGMGKSEEKRPEIFADLAAAGRTYQEILKAGECTSLKTLKVNGGMLIANGIPAGRHMGEILQGLLEEVLDDSKKNEKEYLLRRAKELYELQCRQYQQQ